MLLFGIHWIFHLLSFVMCYAQCCHGDGSGVRHVHIKASWPFSLLSGYCVGNSDKFIVAMATGDTCVQSTMGIRTIIRLLCW